MRLNKYIASSGEASRRGADELIAAGVVQVNGVVITNLGTQVEPGDTVTVRGQVLELPSRSLIVAWYKPVGVTTTLGDRHARLTLRDVLPLEWQHLKPVGRLDRESEGLLLLTDDGDLAYELTHPKFEHEKEYAVTLDRPLTSTAVRDLLHGYSFEDGYALATRVTQTGDQECRVVLCQGLKRQLRRMFERAGYGIVKLQRIRIGQLELGTLQPGQGRVVTRQDILLS
jgi:pseudouridine synthase